MLEYAGFFSIGFDALPDAAGRSISSIMVADYFGSFLDKTSQVIGGRVKL